MSPKRSAAILFVLASLGAAPAAAQVVVSGGGHLGSACLNGGPACVGTSMGPFASVQWLDRVTLRLRYLTVDIGDRAATHGQTIVRTRERGGQMTLGEFEYNFRPGRAVRPFAGVSIGRRVFRHVMTCEPLSCAEADAHSALGGVKLGPERFEADQSTLGIIAGFTGTLPGRLDRLSVQALVGFHDPLREHGETVEGSVLVGIALWRRR